MLDYFCRLAVAERLLPQNFDLAFRALHAFGSDRPARTFASVAASLARRDDLAALKSLLGSVQGTITDAEWDEVCLFPHILFCWLAECKILVFATAYIDGNKLRKVIILSGAVLDLRLPPSLLARALFGSCLMWGSGCSQC